MTLDICSSVLAIQCLRELVWKSPYKGVNFPQKCNDWSRKGFFLAGFTALSFLQCFDTVGLVKGRTSGFWTVKKTRGTYLQKMWIKWPTHTHLENGCYNGSGVHSVCNTNAFQSTHRMQYMQPWSTFTRITVSIRTLSVRYNVQFLCKGKLPVVWWHQSVPV